MIQRDVIKPSIRPRRMRLRFDDSIPNDWCGNVYLSRFFDALSITFPEGERFFVESVRAYKDQVEDPQLLAAINGFVTQESLHSREHQALNRWLATRGYPIDELENVVKDLLGLGRRFSPAVQLGFTCSLEHCTAILGEHLLESPLLREQFHEQMRDLWMWHCVEETEHKGVAFDVFEQVSGDYAIRSVTHVIATGFFLAFAFAATAELLRRDGRALDLKVWAGGMRALFGEGGHMRKLGPAWLTYFGPSFHPWQRDTREMITRFDAILPAR